MSVCACAATVTLLMAGCFVAVPRYSRITEGFSFDCGAGPTVFQGVNFVNDPDNYLGFGSVPSTNIGPWAYLRWGYGFTEWLGLDLSCAGFLGPDLAGKHPASGFLQTALAVKFHPWRSNQLLLLECRDGDYGLGWVFGLPTEGAERFTGSLTAYKLFVLTGSGLNGLNDYLPNDVAANFAWNFYLRPGVSTARLSPNIGGTCWVAWRGGFRITPCGLQLGIAYQP